MRRKNMHYTEVIPLPKRRAAGDRHIGEVIEIVVCWMCVLACAAMLILLSSRSAPAAEPSAVIFSINIL